MKRFCLASYGSLWVPYSVLVLLSLLFVTSVGCGLSSEAKEEEEHVDHVLPPHFPKDFAVAVDRLQMLHDHLAKKTALEPVIAGIDPNTEVRDLIKWLPQLAADSDLGESDWTKVNEQSGAFGLKHGVADGEVSSSADKSKATDPLSAEGLASLQALIEQLRPVQAAYIKLKPVEETES